ncbi:MAG: hypothetical protein U5L46_15255 [Agrobacterium sp.]|nr:hypothetical protein [Agrobacterium sp.]
MKRIFRKALSVTHYPMVRGAELIKHVKQAAKNGGVVNIIFHGIGGDHIAVSSTAHQELVEFLAANRDKYWTDTYLNIMTYVNNQSQ